MSALTDIAGGFMKFLSAAGPTLVELWQTHGQDNAAALRTLKTALTAARAQTDADLKAKYAK